ncbi:MAG: sigma-70 family RNA polymerase sigma factor [Chloroflexota bacterium]|nr:sigma-70 family RNA polymerase sigma factor [Chloroflexota bacterium]
MQDDEEQERRWLTSCRKGDSNACARVVRAYQDTALRTAFLMTNDRQAAEDIAQNAFLNAFRHLNRFDLERPFRPWFLTILANEARMHLRARKRRPATELPDDLPDGADADAILTRLIRDDERARVRAALAELDEPFRTTVILFYFNDLSVDEIANATDSQPGTVKSRLHRGRQHLRHLLGSERAAEPEITTVQPGWRASR